MSEQLYVLPPGWMRPRLHEVCAINPRHEKDALTNEELVSFVPMAAVDDQSGIIRERIARHYGEVRKGFTHFSEGDVLFARITPCMENGKIAVARDLVNGLGCGTTEFHVLRPLGGILPDYLHRYLRQESFRRTAAANMSGTAGQLRVPTDYIRSVEIPIAPLPEQRRIVAKIEQLFEQSCTARAALDRIPPLLRKFRQSVLAAAFRGDLTRDWREQHPDIESASVLLERIRTERRRKWEENLRAKGKDPRKIKYEKPHPSNTLDLEDLPKGWAWACFGEVVSSMKNGIYKPAKVYGGGVPCLRMYNIENGKIVWKDIKLMRLTAAEVEEYRLLPGDILLNRVNSRELVGKAAVIPKDLGDLVFESKNIRIRVSSAVVAPEYLSYYLLTHRCRGQIELGCKQTVGMATVSQSDIASWSLPFAPRPEQQWIVTRIQTLLAQADTIEATVEAARRRADKLEQSILARAFRGELVLQDPADQPAGKLLERIRTARPGDTSTKVARRNPRRRTGRYAHVK